MKTAELAGAQLDYWVAKAEGIELSPHAHRWDEDRWRDWNPSTDWRDGGPIIERERIGVIPFGSDGLWQGSMPGDVDYYIGADSADGEMGPSPLIAAMRAYVASKFGEEVLDIPIP